MSCGVKPWFDAFVGSRGGSGKDSSGGGGGAGGTGDTKMGTCCASGELSYVFNHVYFLGIPMTKKKFAELELSLLHLQQNVEIPETHLIIHPVIQRAVEHVTSLLSLSLFSLPPSN